MFYKKYGKRIFDFSLAFILLALLWPVIVVVALLVYFKLGDPIFFRQTRPGKDEKLFTIYKFRTMTSKRDETGEQLADYFRMTSFGKHLRATSLDELPELWNILKGDMSFVGPRPLLVSYLPYYDETERKRHQVRPGLTGLAQISGRNNLDWPERLALDVNYVENVSFKNDLAILFATVKKVLNREDVVVAGQNHVLYFDQYKRMLAQEAGKEHD